MSYKDVSNKAPDASQQSIWTSHRRAAEGYITVGRGVNLKRNCLLSLGRDQIPTRFMSLLRASCSPDASQQSIWASHRSSQESPGGPRRAQQFPGEHRSCWESPGAPRSGPRRVQELRGEPGRSQESPGAPRRDHELPGELRSSREKLGGSVLFKHWPSRPEAPRRA